MTYKAAYLLLYKHIEKRGYSIVRKKISIKDDARVFIDEHVIIISSRLKWKDSLKALVHEWGHILQSKQKRWKRFINSSRLKDTPKNREYVISAEIDASKKGQRILDKMGLKNLKMEELNPEMVEKYYKNAWINEYIEKAK